jgi:hypothetical protein
MKCFIYLLLLSLILFSSVSFRDYDSKCEGFSFVKFKYFVSGSYLSELDNEANN